MVSRPNTREMIETDYLCQVKEEEVDSLALKITWRVEDYIKIIPKDKLQRLETTQKT